MWHRAAAALGPDEHVAAALDDAARRAERRGAAGVAISALQRAAQFSEEQGSRGARLLRAASIAFDTGQPGLGPQLLAAAGQLDLSAEERTWLSWQRGVYGTDWSGADRLGSFVALAERMRADGRADVAMESLLGVAMRCWWGNPAPPVRVAVTDTAERLGLPADDPRLLAVLALADPVGRGAQVIDQISQLAPDAADPVGMHLVGLAASSVWAYDLSLGFLSVAVEGCGRRARSACWPGCWCPRPGQPRTWPGNLWRCRRPRRPTACLAKRLSHGGRPPPGWRRRPSPPNAGTSIWPRGSPSRRRRC